MATSNHFELKLCQTKEDLILVHEIREATLFKGYPYDRHHADDQNPNNQNFVFLMDGKPVGVVRLDLFDETDAAVRVVAILQEYRGQKIGSRMFRELEAYARKKGIKKLFVNSSSEARSFYEAHGFVEKKWGDPGEGTKLPTIQMVKTLGY